MNLDLSFQLVEIKDINFSSRKRMFELMFSCYNKITEDTFNTDLNKKQYVGLIKDQDNMVQGFTTFAINPNSTNESNYNVLFSGDTIIAPEYWGTQVMKYGWCKAVGSIIASDATKPWYWYLLSKGHRTYMFLPLFFKDYFPSIEPSESDDQLKKIASDISLKLYGDCWKEEEGVIRFKESQGELKEELIQASYQKKGSKFVQFFLKKNPAFYKGEELVCIAHLHPENFLRSAKDLILEGMNHPVQLNI
ncbi:MAG: hypothetical protein ACQETL_04715 [Bacteroidota bacterium]